MILNPWEYLLSPSLGAILILLVWICICTRKMWKHIKENEMIDIDVDFHESTGRIAWIIDRDSRYWDYLKYQIADTLYNNRYEVIEPDEIPLTPGNCQLFADKILLQIFPWPPHRQSGR